MNNENTGGVRCHDADACAMGQLPCPTPGACGCAPAPQAVQAAVPDGWVPCVITYEGQHPEEIAYGPQAMMDRLKKWLDRYFEMRTAPAHPAEEVPTLNLEAIEMPTNPHSAAGDPVAHIAWAAGAGAVFAAVETALAATQPAAQGMEVVLTDAQIDETFNQMPDGAAGFLKSWGYRQFARAVLAAQAKQGGA